MPTPRVAMRKIKECLRLKLDCDLSHERIALSLGLSKGVVSKYVARAEAAGLDWPALSALDETQVAARLCAPAPVVRGDRAPIDLAWVHRELRRKGVTRQLLWQDARGVSHCSVVLLCGGLQGTAQRSGRVCICLALQHGIAEHLPRLDLGALGCLQPAGCLDLARRVQQHTGRDRWQGQTAKLGEKEGFQNPAGLARGHFGHVLPCHPLARHGLEGIACGLLGRLGFPLGLLPRLAWVCAVCQ